jgi:hypothetical protein
MHPLAQTVAPGENLHIWSRQTPAHLIGFRSVAAGGFPQQMRMQNKGFLAANARVFLIAKIVTSVLLGACVFGRTRPSRIWLILYQSRRNFSQQSRMQNKGILASSARVFWQGRWCHRREYLRYLGILLLNSNNLNGKFKTCLPLMLPEAAMVFRRSSLVTREFQLSAAMKNPPVIK